MCDITAIRRSTCHRNVGNWLKPVKLTKWELPIPSSRAYWERVCGEVEKKCKRVRDPYSSLIPLSAPSMSLARTQLPDDIKFKISPPTPIHKIQKPAVEAQDKIPVVISDKKESEFQLSNINKEYKLPSTVPKRSLDSVDSQSAKQIKVYSKQSCPRHKNTAPVKIFDEEISKYLRKSETSAPKLPSITTETKTSYSHRQVTRNKSASSSVHSQKFVAAEENQKRRDRKAPKLGTASLLPSFAKAISIDSLVGIRESLDTEEESFKEAAESDAKSRHFLHIPNLSFISSYPSFRKLSLVDSYDEDVDPHQDISVLSKEEFLHAEKSLRSEKESASKTKFAEKEEKPTETKESKTSTVVQKDNKIERKILDFEKKYAYKALDVITKHKHPEIKIKTKVLETKASSSSSDDSVISKISERKNFKSKCCKNDKEEINFKEIHSQLKKNATKFLSKSQTPKSLYAELEKNKSITIRSSSRSTSGLSPVFNNYSVVIPSTKVLQKIPQTKVFQRAYIDKCHACLHKPFKAEIKVNRELPLTTIKSVVETPPEFSSHNTSISTDSSVDKLLSRLEYDRSDDDSVDFSKFDDLPLNTIDDKYDTESKDQLRVSFDETNLSPTLKTVDTLSATDRSPSQSSHHLKNKSFSMQSSDRSKTSTPSNQSSDSEENRLQEDGKMPSSKYMAPCHAPTVWRPSLDPLRAIRHKKFMTLRQRAAVLTVKSSESGDSDSQEHNLTANDKSAQKAEAASVEDPKTVKDTTEKKEKKKKPLLRMKTVAEKLITSTEPNEEEKMKPKMLKRAKTTFDLTTIADDSKSEESSEEEETSAEADDASKTEQKEEQLPYSDAIVMHRAGSPPPPILSTEDVVEIVKFCLQHDFSASELMEKLSKEFAKRIETRIKSLENVEDAECLKLGLNLFAALTDSKRYLNSDIFDPNLEFSRKQPPLTNPRQLRRILPPKSYELIAPILGMPNFAKKTEGTRMRNGSSSESTDDFHLSFDLIVHPPHSEESRNLRKSECNGFNPYALFLKKPRRKAVVWRPLREEDLKGYDPEATLQMRAARLMDKICREFCEWLKKLGGTEQVIDEETLKDMFEMNFTAEACKAMQVVLKEMPTVPTAVVKIRGCREAGELEATRRQIRRDLKVEKRQAKTSAFGSCLPAHLRFRPPQGKLADSWLRCDTPKDLESMDAVWTDITHLDSVRAFVEFLAENRQAASPKLLKNLQERQKQAQKVTLYKESIAQTDFQSEKVGSIAGESESEY